MIVPDREEVRAMLEQALAEGRARRPGRIARLHLELFDADPRLREALDDLVADLSRDTLAEGAELVTFVAPSRFICWNCCGLRFESEGPEAICPNCGESGMLIPPEVTFALDHVEVAG